MIVKILGLADLIVAAIFLISVYFLSFPTTIILVAGIYLLIKGLIFSILLDVASILDVICAMIILLSIPFNLSLLLSSVVLLFLILKGIMSLAS